MIRSILSIIALASFAFAGSLPVKATRASATMPKLGESNYSTRNLIDGSASTVWAAPFQLKSIFVELKVDAHAVSALHILNGYRLDQLSYENNSRAKTIKIYVNNKQNLVKTVTLKDLPWEYCFGEYDEHACKNFLNTTSYQPSEGEDLKEVCNGICSPMDYSEEIVFTPMLQNVKILIIQIESIYPGKKWNDLVISEISLDGYAQKPLKDGVVPEISSVVDPRDGQEYKTLKLGSKNWMAQNLNYADEGSSCYESKGGARCSEKGRVYEESNVDDGLCPVGWRLPTKDEFIEFNHYVKNRSTDTTLAFADLFITPKSTNSMGMGLYNMNGLCSCFDAGCDGDPYGTDSDAMYDRYHSKDAETPGETALWVKPYKNEYGEEIRFVRFSANAGAYVPYSEQLGCFHNGGVEHRKQFFVRCVEE